MTVDIAMAEQLLDFGSRLGPSQGERAREQLQGAVAIHNILRRHGVAYLADEVGMGKTYVALGVVALFRHFDPSFRVLVIAPRQNIQAKWMKEMGNFVRNNVRFTDLRVRGLGGEPVRPLVRCERLVDFVREVTADSDRDFFLRMTSFSLQRQPDEDAATESRLREQIRHELPWVPDDAFRLGSELKRNIARAINCVLPKFDLVIVDEGHHLKHGPLHAAARNEVLALMMGRELEDKPPSWAKAFGPRAERVLFLSATPLEESFVHVWNQLDVFDKAKPWEGLRLPRRELSDGKKKELVRQFMVRRVTALPIAGERYTKNRYRREWRHGGVDDFDEPVTVSKPRERLVVALVQKKVSELLGSEKFGNRFQIGMLASFESFQETLARRDASTFDGEQTEDELEKQGIDVKPLNDLAKSYRREFGDELPHPKLDAVVRKLDGRWQNGQKALVFVRRVASVRELKRKLDDRYDEWLMADLLARLPMHRQRLQELFDELKAEKRSLRDANQDQVAAQPETSGDEAGSADTFFAWFFRGSRPHVFSGAALKKRFTGGSGVYATFFEENVVAAILGVKPADVPAKLCAVTGRSWDELLAHLRERARERLSIADRLTRAARFEAVQAAATELLADRNDDFGRLAKHVMHQLYDGLGHGARRRSEELSVEEELKQETFFTELRQRAGLAEKLCMSRLPSSPVEFDEHWIRAMLLGSVARLGHAFIDLYVTVVSARRTLDLGRAADDDGDASLISRYLDELERQSAVEESARPFGAYDELRLAAQAYSVILDTNLSQLHGAERRLAEARRTIGNVLAEQQPVGGMFGSVNKTLVSQFRMPGYPLILITTDLLQEGEDLHTFCSEVVHYGISWTPSAMEQRTGRVDRVMSQTERRLGGLARAPSGDEKLQIFVPCLRDTVEVLQVNRVLHRMDRFAELMHEGLGRPKPEDRKVDVEREAFQTIEPPPPPPDCELKSSFVLEPATLRGRRLAVAASEDAERALLERLQTLAQCHESGGHRIDWEPVPSDRHDRLYGTAMIGERKQPFVVSLRLVSGWPVLKLVSPVGRVSPDGRADAILARIGRAPIRLRSAEVGPDGSYDLTVEDEVVLQDPEQDAERFRILLDRVIHHADELESALLQGRDEPMSTFKKDLVAEGNHDD